MTQLYLTTYSCGMIDVDAALCTAYDDVTSVLLVDTEAVTCVNISGDVADKIMSGLELSVSDEEDCRNIPPIVERFYPKAENILRAILEEKNRIKKHDETAYEYYVR